MENEMERKDEASTPNATEEGPDVAGGLPELSRFERNWAQNPNQKSWAFKNMSAGVGHVWHMDDMGLVLQVASEDTMRLLTVVDHDYCRKMVSFVKATLESLELKLDLSQAITRPYSGGAVKPDAERRPVSALQLARANAFTDDIAARRRGRAHALSHGDDEARHGFAPKPPDS